MRMKKLPHYLFVFGVGLMIITAVISWRIVAKHGTGLWMGIPALIELYVLVCLLVWPEGLLRIYGPWMKGVHVIGVVVTTIVLTALFYGVLTPMGLLARWAGKDFLQDKNQDDTSFWKKLSGSPPSRDDYRHQF